MINAAACHIRELVMTTLAALLVDKPLLFNQNMVYGSMNNVDGVIPLKKAIVKEKIIYSHVGT